jgi:hypothetical protein
MPRQHVLFRKRRSKRVSSDFRDCITFRYVTRPYWFWNASREDRTCRKASSSSAFFRAVEGRRKGIEDVASFCFFAGS